MARTDVQLMLDVKAGDEASFELLLRKYRTPLVNFLYRMVRDVGVAEELAQEVFLRVYRAREDYAPSAKFTTWMFRIAAAARGSRPRSDCGAGAGRAQPGRNDPESDSCAA
jgi:DNA-directed RNA polymerase specialized sigma24 family protein